jgi:hypothetical protein
MRSSGEVPAFAMFHMSGQRFLHYVSCKWPSEVGQDMATVRYIVDDVEAAIAFYTGLLGFELKQDFGPAIGIVEKDDLELWVAGPPASAQRPMPDGSQPAPGGWNRFVVFCLTCRLPGRTANRTCSRSG